MREMRVGKIGDLREADDGRHYVVARVCTYGAPDTYGTSWQRGVFTRSLERHLPTAVWSHDWSRPIGKVSAFEDTDEGLDVTIRMSDFEVNPDAKRMWHHFKDGEIEQFSFAFQRVAEERDAQYEGVTKITEASMDEVSPCLRGSVPGTKVMSLRDGETVSKATAANLFVKFATGTCDLTDALYALKTMAGTGEGAPPIELPPDFPQPDDPEDKPGEVIPVPQPDKEDEEVLSKLASLSRSRR